jgi:EAL domain-containing protein (putative c-di-GMP-specific phosphodiesterase class I)/GGDEF domain-containing protein
MPKPVGASILESEAVSEQIVEAVREAAREWRCLCLVEIANFASLRRHVGRARADELARAVATRIRRVIPHAYAHPAGRALIELTLEGDAAADFEAALDTIATLFAEPVDIDGEAYALELLFGAAATPLAETEEVRLIEEAEAALEQARSDKAPVLRDLSAGTPAFDRLTLMRELPAAVVAGEMLLQYQPKVHVRRQEVASVEALVRWQHPERGLILPGDFIPAAEEAREVSALTLWTLERAIADQRVMALAGFDIPVFLNISGQLLADAAFVASACELVQGSHARIGFEITETSVIRDPQGAIENLHTFADVGITIAIDDYGAGLSSLAYLKQLPASELKIDKMFVMQLTSSNRDPLIVRSTIDLAHALEMEVVAEGVETQASLALLSVMGCDLVQGYLISRPIGIDALLTYLHDHRAQKTGGVEHPMFRRPKLAWKTA